LAQSKSESDDDALDRARRLDKVATQKVDLERRRVEADMRIALREAERLAQTDPGRGVERVKKALAQLDDDTLLSKEQHAALKSMFQDRIRVFQIKPEELAAIEQKKKQFLDRRAQLDKQKAEQENIRASLQKIDKLEKEGKPEEASRAAGEFAKDYPDKPAVQAREKSASAAQQMADARKLKKDAERGWLGAANDVAKSAIPPAGDVEFDKKYWKDVVSKRTDKIKLTAKEKEALNALNSRISVDFKGSKFEDVITYLESYLRINLIVDNEALKNADIPYDTPVTLKLKNVSTRTILRKMLGELGLTYVIRDEEIQITSIDRAKSLMTVRKYYIGDLIAGFGLLGQTNPLLLTPGAQAVAATDNARQIIEMIETSIDPSSWRQGGGNGTITYHAPSMSLIIKQSAEVHALLGSGGLGK
jgi:hypothetical protein